MRRVRMLRRLPSHPGFDDPQGLSDLSPTTDWVTLGVVLPCHQHWVTLMAVLPSQSALGDPQGCPVLFTKHWVTLRAVMPFKSALGDPQGCPALPVSTG